MLTRCYRKNDTSDICLNVIYSWGIVLVLNVSVAINDFYQDLVRLFNL